MFDSLGDRMKNNYENRCKPFLTRRTPVIMRLDGKAFHTFTRGCEKPYDEKLSDAMLYTSKALFNSIQGAKLVYTQSDEISILVTDYDKLETDAWFDYNVQKMCSIASSIAGVNFTLKYAYNAFGEMLPVNEVRQAYFDCRVFNIPKEEVANYFLWRFNDWERNSVAMLAQSLYSSKELHGKSRKEQHEMIFQKGKNWNDIGEKWKNGSFIFKEDGIVVVSHNNIKEFEQRELFINKFI